jgi:hypothetical protein
MRHHFHGDKYDLRKWTLLLRLADELKARILYIAMLTNHEPDKDVDARAWSYFRNLNAIKSLDSRIDYCDENFTHAGRGDYFARMRRRLAESPKPVIVFLDPDTGIAPRKTTSNHVAINEIRDLWSCLTDNDALVIYQHKDRTQNSFAKKKTQLEDALENPCTLVTYKDVAFLLSRR